MSTNNDALIGATVGGCMILEVIGSGGMGVIYKSRQKSLDRIVALKVLAPHLANDINFVSRFQKEARAIARVNHPNILAVYDVGDDNNINYMIMELIDGTSLAELQTDRRGALPWEEATDYIRQAAQGLEAAQAAGIIHRDIKPENLMVTKKGVIKVSDFGLAKEADSVNNTSVDAVMGTPAFMSPEQCDGKKVDGRSDIYSLGGTYYRLITGRLPFEAETAMSMMYRHKHEALIPPNEVVPSIPAIISDVIVKTMAKKREHRYQTMTEVIDAIDSSKRESQSRAESRAAHLPMQMPSMPTPAQATPVPVGGIPVFSQNNTVAMAPPPSQGDEDDGPPPPRAEGSSIYNRLPASTAPTMQRGKSGRMQAAGAPAGSFGSAADSSGQLNIPSGIMGMPPGLNAPDEGYTHVNRGDEMMGRGDRANGIKAYREALRSSSLDNATRTRVEQEIRKEVNTRRQAVDTFLKRGMLMEASRECRILNDLDPGDETARMLQKDIDQKVIQKRTVQNDIRTAIAGSDFEKAIRIWDGTPSELRDDAQSKQIEQLRNVVIPSQKLAEQGENFSQQGRLEEAISTYEDALKINPTCEAARMGYGVAQSKLQRIEHMLKEGYQFSTEQNFEKAIETWKPILQLRPGHPQAVKSIVDAYLAHAQNMRSQGDLEKALACYKGAKDIDSGNKAVRRLFDEVTNLRDKEQALIDRAQEASARNKLNEAIRNWKEVLRVNPANKKAAQNVTTLTKQRSSGLIIRVAMLLVFGVVAVGGFQFYTETTALKRANDALKEDDGKKAGEILSNARIIFHLAEAKRLHELARYQDKLHHVTELENEGDNAQAAVYLANMADDFKSSDPEKFKTLSLRAALNDSKHHRLIGEQYMRDAKWELATESFTAVRNGLHAALAQAADIELTKLVGDAEKVILFLDKLTRSLNEKEKNRIDQATDGLQKARALVDGLALNDKDRKNLKDFISTALAALGYEPEKARAFFEAGIAALDTDLKVAREKFQASYNSDHGDSRAKVMLAFVTDKETCDEAGMALMVSKQYNPVGKQDPQWGKTNREKAFCIDRFEYPNKKGQEPISGRSWLEARQTCEADGKRLCKYQEWVDGCKGTELQQFPYGNGKDATPGVCNTDGSSVLPSGAKADCRNALGLYDMSGNLAEWTSGANEKAGEMPAMGGSYKSTARTSGCIDEEGYARDNKPKNVGFRCCKKLPEAGN